MTINVRNCTKSELLSYIKSELYNQDLNKNPLFRDLQNNGYRIFLHYSPTDETIVFEAYALKEKDFQSSYLYLKVKFSGKRILNSPFAGYKTDTPDNRIFYAYLLLKGYDCYHKDKEAHKQFYKPIVELLPRQDIIDKSSKMREDFLSLLNSLDITMTFSQQYHNEIRLEVHLLKKDDYHYYLELYIGKEKLYLIKSINNFLELIRQNGYYSYGSELSFSHNISSFNERGQNLISVLSRIFVKSDETDDGYLLDINNTLNILKALRGEVVVINETNYYVEKDTTEIILNLNTENISFSYLSSAESTLLYYHLNGAEINNQNRTVTILKFKNEREQKVFSFFVNHKDFDIKKVEDLYTTRLLPLLQTPLQNQNITYNINLYITLDNYILTLKTYYFINNQEFSLDEALNDIAFKEKIYDYIKALEKYSLQESMVISNQDQIIKILKEDLDDLNKYCQIFLSENIRNKVITKAKSIKFSLSFDLDFLSLKYDTSSPLSLEEANKILKAYREKKKFILYKDQMELLDFDELKEVDSLLKDFNINSLDNKNTTLPLYEIFKINTSPLTFTMDQKIRNIIMDIKNYKNNTFQLNPRLENVLKPYQKEAFLWLMTLKKYHLNGILADDMGLGKTLEMISLISSIDFDKPILIVSPKSVIYNWENEFKIWDDSLNVKVIDGDKESRSSLIISMKGKKIYITSYDSLRNDISLYQNKEFSILILDEGQYIKNADALKTKAVKELKSESKFVLTGTPIENSLSDLWSLFDFLLPDYLLSYSQFRKEYEVPIINGNEEAIKRLSAKTLPFILRRTKNDVLQDLPAKYEEINIITLSQSQKDLYDAYLTKAKKSLNENMSMSVLAMITRLREVCLDPSIFLDDYNEISSKLTRAIELVSRSLSNHHKVIIFSSFKSCLEHLRKLLKEENIASYFIHGGITSLERLNLANSFNNPADEVGVMLVSLKAGGTGLNLIGGDIVILLDPWWNNAIEEQAFDRAHRIGQKNNVTVIKLIAKDSIESKIINLQKLKKELQETFISSKDKLSTLSLEDISYLLS